MENAEIVFLLLTNSKNSSIHFKTPPKKEAVEVNWSIATELNSAYYIIERSANGYTFSALGTITAAGNSDQLNTYFFLDETPILGTPYYKVKQVDLDVSFIYTNVMVQHFKYLGENSTMEVSVVQQLLQLNFPSYVENGHLEVINSLGQLMNNIELGVNAFSANIDIELNGLCLKIYNSGKSIDSKSIHKIKSNIIFYMKHYLKR